jgi:hypothetical protein
LFASHADRPGSLYGQRRRNGGPSSTLQPHRPAARTQRSQSLWAKEPFASRDPTSFPPPRCSEPTTCTSCFLISASAPRGSSAKSRRTVCPPRCPHSADPSAERFVPPPAGGDAILTDVRNDESMPVAVGPGTSSRETAGVGSTDCFALRKAQGRALRVAVSKDNATKRRLRRCGRGACHPPRKTKTAACRPPRIGLHLVELNGIEPMTF